ncbi:hypothetical protein NON20_18290 [Synechocystis sp. B12]|nr:hypothetical protein NON20_18290 [Synechocystis sp. B12]
MAPFAGAASPLRAVDSVGAGREFVELDPVQGEFCRTLGIKSLLHLPLVINQRHWGILSLQYLHQARPWPLGDQQFAQRIAHLFCLGLMKTELWIHCQNHKNALQTMVAEGQVQRETYLKSAQRERAIADVIDKIRFALDLRSLFQTTVTEVRKLLVADRVMIIKVRQNKNFSWGKFRRKPKRTTSYASCLQRKKCLCHRDGLIILPRD